MRIIIALFVSFSFTCAQPLTNTELYNVLNIVSKFQTQQVNLDEAFYRAYFFNDSSSIANNDRLMSELHAEVDRYTNKNPRFNYCFYAVRGLSSLWSVKKDLIKKKKLEEEDFKTITNMQNTINRDSRYCINNIIGAM